MKYQENLNNWQREIKSTDVNPEMLYMLELPVKNIKEYYIHVTISQGEYTF